MRRRGRVRSLTPLLCPQDGKWLGQTDGRRVYLGAPEPTAVITQRITLCCAEPGCRGHVTWNPPPSRGTGEAR